MRRQKYLYVYILRCSDGSLYTGVTSDLDRRIRQHNYGIDKTCHTYTRRPLEVAYHEAFTDFLLAIAWEKKIKKWSVKKKQALIKSDWTALKEAARCKNDSSHTNYVKPSTNPSGLPK